MALIRFRKQGSKIFLNVTKGYRLILLVIRISDKGSGSYIVKVKSARVITLKASPQVIYANPNSLVEVSVKIKYYMKVEKEY